VVKNDYKADIGLEVHVELATRSKMFCSCAVVDNTQALPNSAVCEVCMGMPGTLPVINQNAVALAIKAALALNCEVRETSIFARKNYFYPDLPKGYQISQYEEPLAENGYLDIRTIEGAKRIRVRRAHLEEDTGKLTHVEKDGQSYSLVDLNRAGVPLLEIVSEPDMHSVDDVRAYSRELRLLLRWLGVSSGDMEKGSMRFEANRSMRPMDSDTLGIRVEIKNLNSFRAMEQAILYQMEMQRETLEKGKNVIQQTLGWSESESRTFAQRSKEEANDYRYFPEPDLPPLVVRKDWLDAIKKEMPELPDQKFSRFISQYSLSDTDAGVLTSSIALADFFETAAAPLKDKKQAANWILTTVLAMLNARGVSITESPVPAGAVAKLLLLLENKTINASAAKTVFDLMVDTSKDPDLIVQEKGLEQVSDVSALESAVMAVITENPEEAAAYRAGKTKLFSFFMGQVMKKTKGKADPGIVKEIFNQKI